MYQLRLLEPNDLPSLMALYARTSGRTDTETATALPACDEVRFAQAIAGRGFVIGAFSDDELIGYSALLFLQPTEQSLCTYAGLSTSELPCTAYAMSALSPQETRGLSLHRKMAAVRAQVARNLGVRDLICVVPGGELRSLHTLLELGFKVRGIKPNGHEYLWVLHCSLADHERPIKFETEVRATDTPRQRDLLALGHIGYGMSAVHGEHYVKYGRRLTSPAATLPLTMPAPAYRPAVR